jgi:hypothetical protein
LQDQVGDVSQVEGIEKPTNTTTADNDKKE